MPVLVTLREHTELLAKQKAGGGTLDLSLDLDQSKTTVTAKTDCWSVGDIDYHYLEVCKDNTVYQWDDGEFAPVARFTKSLIKLVPTSWGPPTFQIDGIKMLPTAHTCPYGDAERKVGLIAPRGKVILDTCGGLGYFAAWCLKGDAKKIVSTEKNPDVLWLREVNPWSPKAGGRLELRHGDISLDIVKMASASFDAALHDPPRFGIAGELYSQVFYDHLARVLKPKGVLFHYTGSPNKLTSGRDVPNEVSQRLRRAGFTTRLEGDGVFASK